MKTVLLMRHAEASELQSGQTDFQRALTSAGQQMARETAELASAAGIRLDRVIASASVRTAQTAEIMALGLSPAAPIVLLEDLYAAPAELFAGALPLHCFPDESSVLIVGHNPGIAMLMCHWAQRVTPVPPATLMVFQFSVQDWNEVPGGSGQLLHLFSDGRKAL